MRSIIIKIIRKIIFTFRRIRGFRSLELFGIKVKLSPFSEMSESVWFHYPKKSPKDRIVAYADYVQWHSLVEKIRILDRPPVILEIGAHHGVYAAVLGKLIKAKGGQFIAVEASPSNTIELKKNITLNDLENVVKVEQIFLSDSTRDGYVYFKEAGVQSTLTDEYDLCSIKVPCESITSFISRLNINHIDILLVDIEGAEAELMPSFPWGTVSVKNIYCELHPGEWSLFGGHEKFDKMLTEQKFICLDMYLTQYKDVRNQYYIGPTVLLKREQFRE